MTEEEAALNQLKYASLKKKKQCNSFGINLHVANKNDKKKKRNPITPRRIFVLQRVRFDKKIYLLKQTYDKDIRIAYCFK